MVLNPAVHKKILILVNSNKNVEFCLSINLEFLERDRGCHLKRRLNQKDLLEALLMTDINILIGGEAGQGIVTIGTVLGKALVRSGFEIVVTQSYHSRIRGGHNTFSIRASALELHGPKEEIDVLLALNKESFDLHRNRLTPGGLVIANSSIMGEEISGIRVPFKELGSSRTHNTVALGVVGAVIGLELDVLDGAIGDFFSKLHPDALLGNRKALKNGYEWGNKQNQHNMPLVRPSGTSDRKLMMSGNEAIALGALSAGLKFCSFYPMTPSTSIVLNIIAHAESFDCITEQAKDEISAINMAIGASFCGAPSMVATSGGGFALMTEGVSLAGMTETPIVIAVAQRPGPATGLPTRTEQGDLEFVLHAGHGEFPRAIFAPGSVEACFSCTNRAFHLAEKSQGPVFILTDQFLADSYRAVRPFDINLFSQVETFHPDLSFPEPYRRYLLTEDGVSPRLIPGMTKSLVTADSDEHTEDGHITENLTVRKAMHEKRLKKMDLIYEEVIPPLEDGDEEPELLFISWGSSQGPVKEAAQRLRKQSRRVKTLHFDQVWPLVLDQFLEKLETAGEVICVEGNYSGQFARLIRRETGFSIPRLILRYDGLPFTADYIISQL